MSKTIPTDYSARNTINYRARSPGRASDWGGLADDLNGFWAGSVWRWGGHFWPTSNPFDPNGTTYTGTNSNDLSRDLDDLLLVGSGQRFKNNDNVEVGFVAYGRDVQVKFDLTNEDTASFLGTTSGIVGSAGSLVGFEVWDDLTASEVDDGSGGVATITASLECRWTDEAGVLYGVTFGERIISDTGKLPDGT